MDLPPVHLFDISPQVINSIFRIYPLVSISNATIPVHTTIFFWQSSHRSPFLLWCFYIVYLITSLSSLKSTILRIRPKFLICFGSPEKACPDLSLQLYVLLLLCSIRSPRKSGNECSTLAFLLVLQCPALILETHYSERNSLPLLLF